MSITKKQKEVFEFIKNYHHSNGYAPTQQEIKDHFNFKSFGSVQKYIKYLTLANYIECNWNARRGLKIIHNSQDHNTDSIPLLGDIAAGDPILAIENPTETIQVPSHMIKAKHQYFALTVKGNSMIEDGILDRDVIICKVSSLANQGQTVVAIINQEATVKNFFKKNNHIELRPANSKMKPIIVNSGDFKIAGTLVGLIRSYAD